MTPVSGRFHHLVVTGLGSRDPSIHKHPSAGPGRPAPLILSLCFGSWSSGRPRWTLGGGLVGNCSVFRTGMWGDTVCNTSFKTSAECSVLGH